MGQKGFRGAKRRRKATAFKPSTKEFRRVQRRVGLATAGVCEPRHQQAEYARRNEPARQAKQPRAFPRRRSVRPPRAGKDFAPQRGRRQKVVFDLLCRSMRSRHSSPRKGASGKQQHEANYYEPQRDDYNYDNKKSSGPKISEGTKPSSKGYKYEGRKLGKL